MSKCGLLLVQSFYKDALFYGHSQNKKAITILLIIALALMTLA